MNSTDGIKKEDYKKYTLESKGTGGQVDKGNNGKLGTVNWRTWNRQDARSRRKVQLK